MSSVASPRVWLLSYAGLIVGPALWALNTQLGQMLPYFECQGSVRMLAIASFAGAAFAALVGALSLTVARKKPSDSDHEPTWNFISMVSGLAALLFAFALALQGAASLVLSGCEH